MGHYCDICNTTMYSYEYIGGVTICDECESGYYKMRNAFKREKKWKKEKEEEKRKKEKEEKLIRQEEERLKDIEEGKSYMKNASNYFSEYKNADYSYQKKI